MAKTKAKTVRLLANLGLRDIDRYDLPEGVEGDVIEVDERQYQVLTAMLCCAVAAEPENKPVRRKPEVVEV